MVAIEREIFAYFKYSEKLLKQAQTNEDIKMIPGVNPQLFDAPNWAFVNRFMNELNSALIKMGQGRNLSGQAINFQAVVRNPSQSTSFTGTTKDLFDLASKLWDYVKVSQAKPYTTAEIRSITNELTRSINSFALLEPNSSGIKNPLINALNAWQSSIING